MSPQTYINLPNGIRMPAIGLGTFLATDEEQLEIAVQTAIELGYRHIDTAYGYRNETVIGRTIQKLIASGKIRRQDLFITTKLPMEAIFPDKVEEYLTKSLDNLRLDYVDLYLVHYPVAFRKLLNTKEFDLDVKTDHIGVWQKMEEQVDAGRTKLIGLSNFNKSQIENILKAARIKPANLQIELHVHFQQRILLDFCRKNGISVVAYAPLGAPGYHHFLSTQGIKTACIPQVLQDHLVADIAQKHSKSSAQVLLRYLLQLGVAAIPKSVTPSRIKENFDVFDFVLDDDDVRTLAALDQGPKARIFNSLRFKGIEKHPDYPFKDCVK